MDYSEKWGTDVDEAVRLALIDLKLTIDEVDVVVLEEPSKGFFGIGSRLAKVRVERKKKEEAVKVQQAPIKPSKPESVKEDRQQKPAREEHRRPEQRSEQRSERPERAERPPRQDKREKKIERIAQFRPDNLVEVTEHVGLDFIREVMGKMGLALQMKASGNEEVLYIDIEGKDSGTIIGKRGQTLDSIQYLTSLVVNKDREKYMRVVVDAESYRAKRERTLEQLANRLADKVIRTKKSVRLEPMNPYERKVIHATLQSNPHITTRSEGEEPYRRVIIELK